MSALLTPQLVDVIDTATAVRSYSSGAARRLRSCHLEPWGLAFESATPEDPAVDAEISWLLPDDGLRLTVLRPRSRHARIAPTVLTAVRIEHDARHWRTTDLLLGLAVPRDRSARIAGAEEFAAAVAGGVLRPPDADLALAVVHRTLEQLARHRHQLASWLAARGILRTWPPR